MTQIRSHMVDKKVDYLGTGNPNWKGGRQNTNCIICGRIVYIGPKYKNKRIHCSRICWGITRKNEMLNGQFKIPMYKVHPRRMLGKSHSKYTRKLISKKLKGRRPHNKYHLIGRYGNDNPATRPEVREKIRIARLKQKMPTKDTNIEKIIKHKLEIYHIKYQQNSPIENLCQPDFVIESRKVAIFADGCYWHGCPIHCPDRAERRLRDQNLTNLLISKGWMVLRFWEHDILDNLEYIEDILQRTLGMERYVKNS